MKLLRPERCVLSNEEPCAACRGDIELENEIKELEKQMNELQSRIKEIETRRRPLRTTMNENHDPLIHKFPPEIVFHIFAQIEHSPHRPYFGDFPRSTCFEKSSLLYLGAVCQKWRQLAWATPELWTSLYIEYPGRLPDDLPQLVTEWLERSAGLPLTIRYVDRRERIFEDDPMIAILNKHSARWHDMHFDLLTRHLHLPYGSSQENILRRLFLQNPYSRGELRPSTFSMKAKPSLAELTLTRVGLSLVDILWNNLTVASLNKIGIEDCVEVIRRAPRLESLTLGTIHLYSSFSIIPSPRIVHPHLQSLKLSAISKENVGTILDLLCFPSLEQWTHSKSGFPLDSMISFGLLSSRLTQLTIGVKAEVSYHEIVQFLSGLSSFERLIFRPFPRDYEDGSDSKFLDLLCISAQSPTFLPRLRSLEFIWNWFPWSSLPQIFTIPRWQALRVKVDTSHVLYIEVDARTAKILLEFVEKGADVHLIGNGQVDLLEKHRKG